MTIWNLRQISDPEAKEAALRYLYQEVMYSPLRCTYRRFKKKLLQSVPGRLPQYYVFEKEGRYMGYFLMIAEEEEKTPRLFPWLACHNGDTLGREDQLELLNFMEKETKQYGVINIWKCLEEQFRQ